MNAFKEALMDDNDKNKVKGFGEEAKGKGKQALGDLRDDDNQKAEGKADEMMGKVRKGVADAKDKLKDAADDLKK